MRTNRYVSVVGAIALAATLASCTASTNEPTPGPSASPTGTQSDLPPIEALQAEVIGTVDDEAWARVENDVFEAAVAACMQAAGFEYTPQEYVSDSVEEDTETLEWAREHGYGISTTPDGESADDEEYELTANDEYLAGLSDEELDAYWIAFEGEVTAEDEGEGIDLEDLDEDGDGEIDLGDLEVGEDGEIDLGDLETGEDGEIDLGDLDEGEGAGGCQGAGEAALAENPLPYDLPEHAEVLSQLDEMYATMSGTDEILEAEEAWIACMADAGYPDLETTEDASYIVFDAYDAAWEQVPEDAEDIDPALLAPVTELEIEVATADYGCRDSAGLTQAYERAQHEAETAFVAEHREALVAFFEDMGAALKS